MLYNEAAKQERVDDVCLLGSTGIGEVCRWVCMECSYKSGVHCPCGQFLALGLSAGGAWCWMYSRIADKVGWLLLINEQLFRLCSWLLIICRVVYICSLRRRLRLPRSALGVGPDCGMYGTFDKILYS